MQLPALGVAGRYAPRRRQLLTDVYGHAAAELAVVPNIYVVRTVAALRAAAPLPLPDRLAALDLAGQLFAEGGSTESARRSTCPRSAGWPESLHRQSGPRCEGSRRRPPTAPLGWPRRRDRGAPSRTGVRRRHPPGPRCGPAAPRCSRCTRRATTRRSSRPGWRRSSWATALPSGPRPGSPSPRTGWSPPCAPAGSAPTRSPFCPPTMPARPPCSRSPISAWFTAARTWSSGTAPTRGCWFTARAGPRFC